MNIEITASAVRRVADLLAENPGQVGLRIYIEGGGCGGMQYGFSFETQAEAGDFEIVHEGITFFIDHISAQYLEGAKIDYVEDLMGASFQIENPNAQTTCGCGSSFSI